MSTVLELVRALSPSEQLQHHFKVSSIQGIKVILEDYDIASREVEIVSIEAAHKGRGAGTRLMQEIVTHADGENISLMLIVNGEPESEKYYRLVRFYVRFGFEVGDEPSIMRRAPKLQSN